MVVCLLSCIKTAKHNKQQHSNILQHLYCQSLQQNMSLILWHLRQFLTMAIIVLLQHNQVTMWQINSATLAQSWCTIHSLLFYTGVWYVWRNTEACLWIIIMEYWRRKEHTRGRRREEIRKTAILFKLADGGRDFDVLAFLQSLLAFNEIVHSIYHSLNQLDLCTFW